MAYRELAPPADLRQAVACLWIRDAGPEGDATRVLPDACADLVWRAGSGAFVAGPDTGPVLADAPPGSLTVGVRFRPGAGGAALGIPLSELRDLRARAAELSPRLDALLAPELEPDAVLARLGDIARRLVTVGPPDPLVGEVARRLRRPDLRVERLATDLGVSERQLRRRCHAGVGYGPKTLQRVLRFRRFLAGIDAPGSTDLARLALDAGYADQAHLTRECTRLAGLAPARLVRTRA